MKLPQFVLRKLFGFAFALAIGMPLSIHAVEPDPDALPDVNARELESALLLLPDSTQLVVSFRPVTSTSRDPVAWLRDSLGESFAFVCARQSMNNPEKGRARLPILRIKRFVCAGWRAEDRNRASDDGMILLILADKDTFTKNRLDTWHELPADKEGHVLYADTRPTDDHTHHLGIVSPELAVICRDKADVAAVLTRAKKPKKHPVVHDWAAWKAIDPAAVLWAVRKQWQSPEWPALAFEAQSKTDVARFTYFFPEKQPVGKTVSPGKPLPKAFKETFRITDYKNALMVKETTDTSVTIDFDLSLGHDVDSAAVSFLHSFLVDLPQGDRAPGQP